MADLTTKIGVGVGAGFVTAVVPEMSEHVGTLDDWLRFGLGISVGILLLGGGDMIARRTGLTEFSEYGEAAGWGILAGTTVSILF